MYKQYRMNVHGVMTPQDRQNFSYTDGAQEERRIARIIGRAEDRSVFSPEFLHASKLTDWVGAYHLSPQRTYLLRPVQHLLKDKTVLELGAGCGALTRYMGEQARRIVALEGSQMRAGITAIRCRDLSNVAVINDTIQCLQLLQKFDIVTLIGVLEYARMYDASSESPELAVLRKARDFLKPGGSLLLAIENRMGLKYLAGAKEDHVSKPFFGVHGLYGRNTPVTFGRFEMENLLRRAGFRSLTQLIPLPDYKLPVTVLHPASFDGSRPAMNIYPLLVNSVAYDRQPPSKKCFSLESAYRSVIENGLLPDLCNSLYYIASCEDGAAHVFPEILASHYGGQRYKEFAQETLFVRDKDRLLVTKRHLYEDVPHEKNSLINTPAPAEEYATHGTLHEKLIPVLNTPGWTVTDLVQWSSPWISYLRSREHAGNLPGSCMDMTPANFFIDEAGGLTPFDCEWSLADGNDIPFNFVALRGLFNTLAFFSSVAPPGNGVPVMFIPLIIKILSEHAVLIGNDDVELFACKYAEFSIRVNGREFDINSILNARLKIRESA